MDTSSRLLHSRQVQKMRELCKFVQQMINGANQTLSLLEQCYLESEVLTIDNMLEFSLDGQTHSKLDLCHKLKCDTCIKKTGEMKISTRFHVFGLKSRKPNNNFTMPHFYTHLRVSYKNSLNFQPQCKLTSSFGSRGLQRSSSSQW